MSTVHPAQVEHQAHVVSPRVLLSVFGALLALTVATVGFSYLNERYDFGSIALAVALGIALLKASLVALYFMHLRYDSPFYAMVLITALLFVMLFIGIALLDTGQYQVNLQ